MLLVGLPIFAVVSFALNANAQHLVRILLALAGPAVPASSAIISEHELEEINAMQPTEQAKRLLERTINHYKGAPEEISKRLDQWAGHIESSKDLDTMTNTAYFSSDLRVRAAALEIWLAQHGFQRTTQSAETLISEANLQDDRRYFRLSNLGILGNRGVEPEKALETLLLYVHDPDPSTRSGAINGLGLLGTDGTIAPLLDVFHNDPSRDLRERAACNLADAGMLSREQRQKAVPELIQFSQDPALDDTTKKWVYQALREITEQNLANQPSAWANWYAAARK